MRGPSMVRVLTKFDAFDKGPTGRRDLTDLTGFDRGPGARRGFDMHLTGGPGARRGFDMHFEDVSEGVPRNIVRDLSNVVTDAAAATSVATAGGNCSGGE